MGSELSQVLRESLYSLGTQVEEIHTFRGPRQGTIPLQISTYPSLEWVLIGDFTHGTPPSLALSRMGAYLPGGVAL